MRDSRPRMSLRSIRATSPLPARLRPGARSASNRPDISPNPREWHTMAKSRPDAARTAHPEIAAIERPTPAGTNAPGFGSDVVAETLRDLDIPYIALNP